MSQSLLEMAKELVMAQIQSQQVAPEAMTSVLHSTYETLQSLQTAESSGANGNGHVNGNGTSHTVGTQAPVEWKSSITKHSIRCLECGETFKQLSLRHLRIHDLDPRSYRVKYNIPRTQALSARAVTARRRELAQQIRPWELAPSKAKTDSKAAAKPKVKAGTAKPAASRATAKKPAAKA